MARKKVTPKLVSAGRKKLEKLGVSLPLFPITNAGSFPKHTELLEMKVRVKTGFQNPDDLLRKENLATETWIRRQESLNFDVLVSGHIRRSDMVSFFADRIDGFKPGGFVRCYGNRYYRKPIIESELRYKGPLIVEDWRFFQRMTHAPLKAIVTGPYTLVDWSFDEHYADRRKAVLDAAEVLAKEIKTLEDAGAKIVQIDEPALSARPTEFPLVAEGLARVLRDTKAYIVLRHAYGDLAPVWQKMQRLPVDNIHLETSNAGFAVLPLIRKMPTKKDLTLGIIESHTHTVESLKTVDDRIRQALRVVSPAQAWFAPDSGLRTRTLAEADGKLAVLASSVKKARGRFE